MKGVDVASDFGRWPASGWLLLCLVAPWHRAGWAGLSVFAFVGVALADGDFDSTHAGLIAWVALAFAVPDARDLLLRVSTTVLYLFAALNKINPAFLAGEAIAIRTTAVPLVPAAIATVLIEAWLAWAVWRRHRWALPAAAVLHVGIVVAMSTTPYQYLMLASFNGMMVLLVWWTTRQTMP